MRRQLVPLTLAALAIMTTMPGASASASDEPSVSAPPPVAAQRVSLSVLAVRDEATMVLVGTALICLGAAVRRAA